MLWAPETYWKAPKSEIKRVCNGCGTAGWKGDLVPDTMWFLDVSPACQIHDYMYHEGRTQEDKEQADRVFLNNLNRIIEADSEWKILKILRRRRARIYYEAVKYAGGPAFWSGKNKDSNLNSARIDTK